MPEVRFELPADDLAVLDGYCSATGKARTDVIKVLLAEWSERKLHEATIVLRVAGRTPTRSESDRSPAGPRPDSAIEEHARAWFPLEHEPRSPFMCCTCKFLDMQQLDNQCNGSFLCFPHAGHSRREVALGCGYCT